MKFDYNTDKAFMVKTKSGDIKLRYFLSKKATKLQGINGKGFLQNREDLKSSYNQRGLIGINLHVATEMLKKKMSERGIKLSWWDKLKIWYYAR